MPSDAATIEELLQPLAQRPERSAVLLDVDGVLAPIVAQPDDAHMPETTRRPLIEVAKRYGIVACVSGRRASDARRIVSLGSIAYLGSHGSEVLLPGLDRPGARPELQAWTQRVQPSPTTRSARSCGGCACAWRTRRRSRPCTGAASPTRTTRWRRSRTSPRRPRRPASSPTGAARCSRSARRCGSTRARDRRPAAARRDLAAAVYVGDDVTDLDAFRGLTELRSAGGWLALRVGVRSDETPAGARGRGRHARRRARRRARTYCAPCCFEGSATS